MIILVRHGQANHHTEDLTGGWTNSELTLKGEKQIKQVAIYLKKILKENQPTIITSDLKRASSSAQIIAQTFDTTCTYYEFLREKNNGQSANKTNEQAKEFILPRQNKEPDNRKYLGGETRREFFDRTVEGMNKIAFTENPLIIVSHKGTLQNILFWWLNLSIDDVCNLAISFDVRPASVSILKVNSWDEHEISLLNHQL